MNKKVYAAAPDVPWVNGAPVPADRLVVLSDPEAYYDLGYARILLDEVATATRNRLMSAGQLTEEAKQAGA